MVHNLYAKCIDLSKYGDLLLVSFCLQMPSMHTIGELGLDLALNAPFRSIASGVYYCRLCIANDIAMLLTKQIHANMSYHT